MHYSRSQLAVSPETSLLTPLRPASAKTLRSTLGAVTQLSWVRDLPDDCRCEAIAAARVRQFRAGAVVTLAGDEASLVALLTGSVFIEAGRSAEDVGPLDWHAAPSSILTGASLVAGVSIITITAASNVTIAKWPRSFTFNAQESRPQLTFALAEILGSMASRAILSAADMQLPTALRRCAAVTLRLSENTVDIKITQETLARMTNVIPTLTDIHP